MELTVPWVVLYTCIALVGLAVIAFPFLVGKAPGILHEVNKLCPAFKAAEGIFEELPSACPICLCDVESEDVLRRLPCNHVFHAACIDTWLAKASMCAMCRVNPLMPRSPAASEPEATVYGSQDAKPSSDVELGLVPTSAIVNHRVEPSVDCKNGQDSGAKMMLDDISRTPSAAGPPAAGSESSVAESSRTEEDAVDSLAKLMPRPIPEGLQEPPGQIEENTELGTIDLLEGNREPTPMYMPGVQDYHTGLQKFALDPKEAGEKQQEDSSSDSEEPQGYVPLAAGLRTQTPLVLNCSL